MLLRLLLPSSAVAAAEAAATLAKVKAEALLISPSVRSSSELAEDEPKKLKKRTNERSRYSSRAANFLLPDFVGDGGGAGS